MKLKLTRQSTLMILFLIVIALGWYFFGQPRELALEQRYQIQTVQVGDLTQIVTATGTLNPVGIVNVGTQVSGIVQRINADFNDHVKQGQILLELDPSLNASAVHQSQANVADARSAFELAQTNEKRAQELFKQEYISQQERDQAIQNRASAQARLQFAQAQLVRDQTNLELTIIRSPVSGVVVDRVVDVGQTVAASFQTPTLFKIARDLSMMQIDSNFTEVDIGMIKHGLSVSFTVDAFSNRTFTGQVRQVRLNSTTQQNVVTYNVVIDVVNADRGLLPGMTAYVQIPVAQRAKVVLVPNGALRFQPEDAAKTAKASTADLANQPKLDGETGTVYSVDQNTLKPITVKLGITDNRNTEILGNALKVGTRIVVGTQTPAESNRSGFIRFRAF